MDYWKLSGTKKFNLLLYKNLKHLTQKYLITTMFVVEPNTIDDQLNQNTF